MKHEDWSKIGLNMYGSLCGFASLPPTIRRFLDFANLNGLNTQRRKKF